MIKSEPPPLTAVAAQLHQERSAGYLLALCYLIIGHPVLGVKIYQIPELENGIKKLHLIIGHPVLGVKMLESASVARASRKHLRLVITWVLPT